MLTLAYDTIAHNDDWTHVVARPNCQFRFRQPIFPDRRYTCGTLVPMCVLDRVRLRCERTEDLLQADRPFIYPLELQTGMHASLVANPELAPGIPSSVLQRVR